MKLSPRKPNGRLSPFTILVGLCFLISAAPAAAATFDWGSDCSAGQGTFEQAIPYRGAGVLIGSIPLNKRDIRIDLRALTDVDVQLITAQGHEIVAWPNGDLSGAGQSCTTYQNVTYCYSGYNGVNGQQGHEYIEIFGTTNLELTMRAWGYQSGDAQVTYSWNATNTCNEKGAGEFTQYIPYYNTVVVGEIPAGKVNVDVALQSNGGADVDVQLFDGDVAIVQWPNGLLAGPTSQSVSYRGMTIHYSGYNGITNLGHESITIEGEVTTTLTMKAFGYQAGTANVSYSWGSGAGDTCMGIAALQCQPGLECKAVQTGVSDPAGECHTANWCDAATVQADCQNVPHIMVVGQWACEEYQCVWATEGGNNVGTGDSINPLVLQDVNSNPNIVEINLSAQVSSVEYQPGVSTEVWTYNGVLGPAIEAKVGDTLKVNFTNNLPEATTVHWHGLELPANMDGSTIAQAPIQPGGQFTYEFKLLRASTFWFHPHVRGHAQVELGLQGLLVVHDPSEDAALNLPPREHWFILDDVLLKNGDIAAPFPSSPLMNAMTQINGRIGNTLLVNGKVGQELEVQIGRPQRIRMVNTSNSRFMRVSLPGHTLYRIGGDAGLLAQPIAIAPIQQVYVNGKMISDPDLSKGLLLTPGERADVVFIPNGQNGDTLALEWHDVARGRHMAMYNNMNKIMFMHDDTDGTLPSQTLMTFNLNDMGSVASYNLPSTLRHITPVHGSVMGHAEVIKVTFAHDMMPDANGNVDFFAKMMSTESDADMGDMDMDMDHSGMSGSGMGGMHMSGSGMGGHAMGEMPMGEMPMVGMATGVTFADFMPHMAPTVVPNESRIIEVVNNTGGMHNFHLHGFMFQHIETVFQDDEAGTSHVVPAAYLENKDTIVIPGRPGAMMKSRSITRLAVTFSDEGREGQIYAAGKSPTHNTSGGWLYHCHVLEHAARGMAGFLQVVAP